MKNPNLYQAMLDGLTASWQRERSETQMTLGELISVLEQMPPTHMVANLTSPHSYRGYYSDLAFENWGKSRPAGELLAECKAAMGQVFVGYKGGDFQMGALTPLWVASEGCCGVKLMALHPDGSIETAEDEF